MAPKHTFPAQTEQNQRLANESSNHRPSSQLVDHSHITAACYTWWHLSVRRCHCSQPPRSFSKPSPKHQTLLTTARLLQATSSTSSICSYPVFSSQNHRMVGVGRDLCGSSSPTPLSKQGHLQQAAQDLVQQGFEYIQRRRLHNLPGQPVPVLRHPQSEEVLPHVQMELPTLQFVPITLFFLLLIFTYIISCY